MFDLFGLSENIPEFKELRNIIDKAFTTVEWNQKLKFTPFFYKQSKT